MPLTPLGKQLRSVLAGLRKVTCDGRTEVSSRTRSTTKSAATNSRRPKIPARSLTCYHDGGRRQQSGLSVLAAAEETSIDWSGSAIFNTDQAVRQTPISPTHRRRRTSLKSIGGVGSTLKETGRPDVVPKKVHRRWDFSTRSPLARGTQRSTTGDSRQGTMRRRLRPRERAISLESILSKYMRHEAAVGTGQAVWENPFHPTDAETRLLHRNGYTLSDVAGWANILSTLDSFEAATLMSTRVRAHGHNSLPFFVFSNVLRRKHLSPRSLRLLLQHAERMFNFRTSDQRLQDQAVFITFLRLLRHAREVWPAATERIAQMLLKYLASADLEGGNARIGQIRRLTHMLNKALRLIVVPTAIEPIKNNTHQERALVRVLQFMASHNPTLQISREGYRAVVLLQLAQRKTAKEQQWAELKALSWPPWKEDRTAMDSFVTAEDHGMSKAAETLLRMREAGYRPLSWEKSAMIYAGWDTDRTPTIQTLTLLSTSGQRFSARTATWKSRIVATRTVQEAWAAFLAYEDATNGADNEVAAAILSKLIKDEQRQRRHGAQRVSDVSAEEDTPSNRPWPLHPGDTREVSELPPSVHLHTYTRSAPPSVDGFFRYMQSKGLRMGLASTELLVANAGSLQLGSEYLIKSTCASSASSALLNPDDRYDIQDVPMSLFIAFIKLLCRFSKVPMVSTDLDTTATGPRFRPQVEILTERTFTKYTAMVHAIVLLQWRHPLHTVPYNTVLQALGHESSFSRLQSTQEPDTPAHYSFGPTASPNEEADRLKGAVTAYSLARRVLRLMRDKHFDLDIDGFRALCQVTENAACATYTIVHDAEGGAHEPRRPTTHLREAVEWLRSTGHAKRLRGEFAVLVGEADKDPETSVSTATGPEDRGRSDVLLHTPSFALLHIYVRALGWMADYTGLLETVRWMARHAPQLAERQKQDRNGDIMLHRTLCALRVFLERSWIPRTSGDDGGGVFAMGKAEDNRPKLAKELRRLRSPAEDELVEEVKGLVEGTAEWSGWPTEGAVERYCRDRRFRRLM